MWRDQSRARDIPAHVYAPTGGASGIRYPLIVLSHGFGETRTSYATLGQAWAKQGYIVVTVNHLGTDADALAEMRKTPAAGRTPPSFLLRPQDISFAIDRATSGTTGSSLVDGRVDPDRIATAGHSMGSSTSLAMVGLTTRDASGKRVSYRDPRVKAAIAMSTQIDAALGDDGSSRDRSLGGQTIDARSWDAITAPAMILHGTKDRGYGALGQNPELRRIVFDSMPPGGKYMVVVKDLEHHAFTDTPPWYPGGERAPRHYGWLEQVTLAFFDAHLKGSAAAKAWLDKKVIMEITSGEVVLEGK
jgi:predicted dienelactone hydrolase